MYRGEDEMRLPKVWIDGKRVKSRAQCAICYEVAEEAGIPKDWKYDSGRGFICPKCQVVPT